MDFLDTHRRIEQKNKRSFTTIQFALVVIAVSVVLLVTGITLNLDGSGGDEVADSQLESTFSPAAGGNAGSRAAEPRKGFSLREIMKKRK